VEEEAGCGSSGGVIRLSLPREDAIQVLCLGAHPDDIEIGCGGTLLSLKCTLPLVKFYWVVLTGSGIRRNEAATSAELFTRGCEKEIVLKEYRDGFLSYGAEVKDFFEELKTRVNPDLIFTHWRGDAHQDHRLISKLTWNTFRSHLILEYEIPKYDGDMGQPGVFVPLQQEICQAKVRSIVDTFQSQHNKPWFQEQTFFSLMHLRGIESSARSGYAEAFHCRKLALWTGRLDEVATLSGGAK
jgi:LmbE family N-acetylglucosaminyl deacetylase